MSCAIVTFYEQHNMPWLVFEPGTSGSSVQHSTTVPPGMLAPSSDYFSYLMTALPLSQTASCYFSNDKW